ncbi:MAG: hypothetical protein NTZ82_03615 [Bacteroidetes bacterium]|nr:hypothetical protein [Bacteroidota bacterium]
MKTKWKSLDLHSLANRTSQVVIGFKTTPQLKLKLAAEATDKGTNIGSYVRNIIENRENNEIAKVLKNENVDLKNKISVYENPEAKAILVNYKGKEVDYYENGLKKTKTINSIDDVYFVIMKSFKTK